MSFFLPPRDGHGFTGSFGALASLPKEPEKSPSLQSRWAERETPCREVSAHGEWQRRKAVSPFHPENLTRIKALDQSWTYKRLEVTAAGFGEERQPAAGSAKPQLPWSGIYPCFYLWGVTMGCSGAQQLLLCC